MIPVGILTAASSFSFLLDDYPGAAVAYSLRKLRTAYTGNCVRIRRSSDNAELDFGFVNNYVDTAAISTFCGAGNGFVTRWYDQSGNANNTTGISTPGIPQIYFSGAFLFRSGKVYIQCSPTATFAMTTNILRTPAQNFSFWFTYEKNATGNQSMLMSSSGYLWLEYGAANQYVNNSETINISPNNYAINTRYLVNHICDTSTITIYSNNNAWGNRITSANADFREINSTANRSATITEAEFVFYSNSQAANRTGITNNINSFYTIY